MNEGRAARGQAALGHERVVRRHEHLGDGCGVAQRDRGGDALEHALVGDELLGLRPARHDAHRLVADRPAGNALAQRRDGAGELEARDLELGLRTRRGVVAHPLKQVGSVHGRAHHVHQDLLGSGRWIGHVSQFEHFDAAVFGNHHCTHGRRRYPVRG